MGRTVRGIILPFIHRVQRARTVRVQMLPSVAGDGPALQFALSYLSNDQVAIDAGSLGFQASLSLQQQVRHLFLTHPHLDHLASLPVWLDNVFQSGGEPPHVYGSPITWSILTGDLMNDRLWPDLARIAATEQPFYVPHLLLDGATVRVAEVEVTAEPLDHVVPTLGYIVDDGDVASAFVSDTGPTDRIWRVLAENPRLRASLLETSFLNRLDWLVEQAKHLTPARVGTERRKLRELNPALSPMICFVHMKPWHEPEIAAEIAGLGLPQWQLLEAGREFRL